MHLHGLLVTMQEKFCEPGLKEESLPPPPKYLLSQYMYIYLEDIQLFLVTIVTCWQSNLFLSLLATSFMNFALEIVPREGYLYGWNVNYRTWNGFLVLQYSTVYYCTHTHNITIH